jgi:hypothetical protein
MRIHVFGLITTHIFTGAFMAQQIDKCTCGRTRGECEAEAAQLLVCAQAIRPAGKASPDKVGEFYAELSRLLEHPSFVNFVRRHGRAIPQVPALLDYLEVYANLIAIIQRIGTDIWCRGQNDATKSVA